MVYFNDNNSIGWNIYSFVVMINQQTFACSTNPLLSIQMAKSHQAQHDDCIEKMQSKSDIAIVIIFSLLLVYLNCEVRVQSASLWACCLCVEWKRHILHFFSVALLYRYYCLTVGWCTHQKDGKTCPNCKTGRFWSF